MDANLLLWIGQVLLALAFGVVGYNHSLGFDNWSKQPRQEWMLAVGKDRMRIIGFLEILGAIRLIVPAATKILPWLTPLAAALLAVLMVFAAIFHARRRGELPNTVFNLVLGLFAAAVAYGRFVIAPIA
jgi:uncharacterized membrane protein